jgi:two-component system chemotaxis response regulator CheY
MFALVVDDSRAMRSIIKNIIKTEGFTFAEAGHGLEALAVLETSEVPDLALVDWNMPEMNGLEFVQAVRAQDRFKSMKILMVTTETDFEYMSRAMEAGADEYLMKPFDKAALRGKLELLGLAAPASIPEAE